VVEITGSIENAGDRKLRLVEIRCVFYERTGSGAEGARADCEREGPAVAPARANRSACPSTTSRKLNQMMPQLVIARNRLRVERIEIVRHPWRERCRQSH